MTVASRVTRPSDHVAALAVAAGLGLLGALLILGSRTQWLLILAPIGAVVIVIAARKPVLALNVMVITEITNLSGVLAPVTGLPLFQASMLLGVVAIGLALRDPRGRARLNTWTVICIGVLGAYLVIESISVLGSVDLTASLGSIRRTGIDCLFAIIVFVLIQITGRPWMAAAAIVAPLAVLSALTVINQVVFGGAATFGGFATVTKASGEMVTTLRYGGPLPDSNFWGRHLVLGVPLGAALITRAIRGRRYLVEVGWAAALLAIFAGIYLTQSRGTFVSAGVAVLVWFVLSGRPVWRSAPIILPLAIGVAAIPGVGNRLIRAVVELSQGQGGGFVDPSLLGRLAAQQQAAMMWQERPVFGFGPGTFPDQVPEFAGRVHTAVRQPAEAPAQHLLRTRGRVRNARPHQLAAPDPGCPDHPRTADLLSSPCAGAGAGRSSVRGHRWLVGVEPRAALGLLPHLRPDPGAGGLSGAGVAGSRPCVASLSRRGGRLRARGHHRRGRVRGDLGHRGLARCCRHPAHHVDAGGPGRRLVRLRARHPVTGRTAAHHGQAPASAGLRSGDSARSSARTARFHCYRCNRGRGEGSTASGRRSRRCGSWHLHRIQRLPSGTRRHHAHRVQGVDDGAQRGTGGRRR